MRDVLWCLAGVPCWGMPQRGNRGLLHHAPGHDLHHVDGRDVGFPMRRSARMLGMTEIIAAAARAARLAEVA